MGDAQLLGGAPQMTMARGRLETAQGVQRQVAAIDRRQWVNGAHQGEPQYNRRGEVCNVSPAAIHSGIRAGGGIVTAVYRKIGPGDVAGTAGSEEVDAPRHFRGGGQ